MVHDRIVAMSMCYVFLLFAMAAGVRGWSDRGLFPTKDDPMGDRDLFSSLTERQKQRWATPREQGSDSKLKKLNGLEISTTIDIHLVGFSGEGNQGLNVGEVDVTKYVDALKKEPWGHVLDGKPHHLNVRRKFLVNVEIASSQLHNDLFNAVRQAIPEEGSAGKPEGSLVSVSHRVVAKILDAEVASAGEVYSIYVLNLHAQDKSYGYSYDGGNPHPCLGTSYAAKGRYFWVDLTAGPVSYGPSLSGEGLVGPRTFPVISTYNGDQHHKAFLADLVAMVWNGVQHLVSPPLDHTPRPFAASTIVHLVHIVDDKSTSIIPDWEAISKELRSVGEQEKILIGEQAVTFKFSQLSLHKCAICSAALARSTKVRMGGTKSSNHLNGHDFVDSKELHHLMSTFYPIIKDAASLGGPIHLSPDEGGIESGVRVVPVFVFDVPEEKWPSILLDGFEQAVAFEDMVVAVRNLGPKPSFATFMCNSVSFTPPESLLRPLMAAILQTVWNVAPTHLTWSDARNKSVEDYRWTVGQTPFGPFSSATSLSFAQRDAALRNVLLAELNRTVGEARDLLNAVQEFGGEELAMVPARMRVYDARFNYFVQKLEKGLQALAAFHWDTAFFFVRSARHDVAAMRSIAQEGAHDLHTSLSCFEEPPMSSWWYLGFPVGGMLVYIAVNKNFLIKSKSKRF